MEEPTIQTTQTPPTEQELAVQAQELHGLVLNAHKKLITKMMKDEEYSKDPKSIRVYNEVLSAASTSALASKKLKIDKDNNDNQQALTAMMVAISSGDKAVQNYVGSVLNRTIKQPVEPPDIAVDGKFDSDALRQGNVTITLEELQSHTGKTL